MDFFDKLFASNFKNKMNKLKRILDKWNYRYQKDAWEEKVIFNKDGYTLIFDEDLREHSIIFSVKYNNHLIFKAGYKEIICKYAEFVTDDLEKMLKQAKNDIEEVDAYYYFLCKNKVV